MDNKEGKPCCSRSKCEIFFEQIPCEMWNDEIFFGLYAPKNWIKRPKLSEIRLECEKVLVALSSGSWEALKNLSPQIVYFMPAPDFNGFLFENFMEKDKMCEKSSKSSICEENNDNIKIKDQWKFIHEMIQISPDNDEIEDFKDCRIFFEGVAICGLIYLKLQTTEFYEPDIVFSKFSEDLKQQLESFYNICTEVKVVGPQLQLSVDKNDTKNGNDKLIMMGFLITRYTMAKVNGEKTVEKLLFSSYLRASAFKDMEYLSVLQNCAMESGLDYENIMWRIKSVSLEDDLTLQVQDIMAFLDHLRTIQTKIEISDGKIAEFGEAPVWFPEDGLQIDRPTTWIWTRLFDDKYLRHFTTLENRVLMACLIEIVKLYDPKSSWNILEFFEPTYGIVKVAKTVAESYKNLFMLKC